MKFLWSVLVVCAVICQVRGVEQDEVVPTSITAEKIENKPNVASAVVPAKKGVSSLSGYLSHLRQIGNNKNANSKSTQVSVAKIKEFALKRMSSSDSKIEKGKDTSSRFSINTGGGVKFAPHATLGQNRYKFGPLMQPSRKKVPPARHNNRPRPDPQYTNNYRPSPDNNYRPVKQWNANPNRPPYGGHTHHHGPYIPPRPEPEPYEEEEEEEGYDGFNIGHHFGSDEYKQIWLQMLQEIYKVLVDKHLIHEYDFISQIFNKLFHLLNDINVLSDHYVDDIVVCPKSYYQSGSVCLVADNLDDYLTFDEARLYCQVVHGGDLAIFRDANEFADIQRYVKYNVFLQSHSFWVGLTDDTHEGDWRFIDGSAGPIGAPFWGTFPNNCNPNLNLCSRRTAKEVDEKVLPQTREGRSGNIKHIHPRNPDDGHGGRKHTDADHAVLNQYGYHYLYPADDTAAEKWDTIPLCQFIPERDQKNYQYGEGIHEKWDEYKEATGWGQIKDPILSVIKPPHKHQPFFNKEW